MTFDNFITALSDVFDWMTDDARRAGGWYWMPALRRVNHAWGGLLQPPEITNWSPAHDEETCHKYWYNKTTEESVWVAPKGVLEYHRLLSIQQKEKKEREEREEREERQDGRSGRAARGMLATVATRKMFHHPGCKLYKYAQVFLCKYVSLYKYVQVFLW